MKLTKYSEKTPNLGDRECYNRALSSGRDLRIPNIFDLARLYTKYAKNEPIANPTMTWNTV